MAPTAPSAAEKSRFREVLGVSAIATAGQIEKAYKKCAMAHHPDMGGATARMAEINNARDWLRENAPPPSPTVLPPAAAPTVSELAAARESRLAAAKEVAAEQLAAAEAIWGPNFRSHCTKGRIAPLSTTSGTAYKPRPEIHIPTEKFARKRTREEQSLNAPIVSAKRPRITIEDHATAEHASTGKGERLVECRVQESELAQSTTTSSEIQTESTSEEPDLVDMIFAGVDWGQPVSANDLNKHNPEFVAWLEDEKAWIWHMCYSEKDGFKLMGSERDEKVFLWKYCCETGAMSMAFPERDEHD